MGTTAVEANRSWSNDDANHELGVQGELVLSEYFQVTSIRVGRK